MRPSLNLDIIKLIVQSIQSLVAGGSDEAEKLSTILKEDLLAATKISDIDFINNVIIPILHSEETKPITISIYDPSKSQALQPIYAAGDAQATKDTYFLKTNLMT